LKILVLGGSGFIGSHIVNALIERGHHIRVLDRAQKNILPNVVEVFAADYTDTLALSESLIGIDLVVHLISTSVPSTSNKDPISDVNGNLINTLKLLDAMKKSEVKRIIYFSSGGTVYGKPKVIPIPETHENNPLCSYGVVKLAIEKYLLMYQALYGLECTILRPSNPYGEGQAHNGVQGFIGTCIHSALEQKTLTLWGDGSVVRDYIHIADVVSATMSVIDKKLTGTYNIGYGKGYSLLEIIQYVEDIAGKKVDVEFKEGRNFDIPEMILDISKLRSLSGWKPSSDIRTGIQLTLNSQ
jgi:UDP-glucose 4-epimerase